MFPDSYPQGAVCLDLAVDHRIRRLFAPVILEPAAPSNHLDRLGNLGTARKVDDDEIKVTQQLAGPATKGGIAVILQQPRNSHPFAKGIDAVIDDCASLLALDDMFLTASCGTLNIRDTISVVDLLPYTSPSKFNQLDVQTLLQTSVQTISAKEPDVLLCAGNIRLPRGVIKGPAMWLESAGVGNSFKSSPMAEIRNEEDDLVCIPRVNSFHPSCAVNYYAHVSFLRQLQILAAAESCGTLRHDWNNEKWMDLFRERCRLRWKSLSGKWSLTRKPIDLEGGDGTVADQDSPDVSRPRGRAPTWDYKELYFETLKELGSIIVGGIRTQKLQCSTGDTLYQSLLGVGLSEPCNDASLILRQMMDPRNERELDAKATERAVVDTLYLVILIDSMARACHNPRLKDILQSSAALLRDQVTIGPDKKHNFNRNGACEAFLSLAVGIESLLLDLSIQQEIVALTTQREADLSNMFGKLGLEEISVADSL
jgi:hypothetical protein